MVEGSTLAGVWGLHFDATGWKVTHLPSGYGICEGFKTEFAAKLVAEKLDERRAVFKGLTARGGFRMSGISFDDFAWVHGVLQDAAGAKPLAEALLQRMFKESTS